MWSEGWGTHTQKGRKEIYRGQGRIQRERWMEWPGPCRHYSCHYSGSRAAEERVQIGKKPGEAAQRRVLAEQVQPSSMGVD